MEINKENIPKISVLIITYNQKDFIGRALDSILIQKESIYEIIISDDCSTDNSNKIINSYINKYPKLIKLFTNKRNLGIFQNLEKSWEYPKGDIIYELSGDDEVGKDWFKKCINFIQENKIDFKNDLFTIYGDSKCVYPTGHSMIIKNNAILSGHYPIKLFLRGLINKRSTCFSIKILKKFKKVSQGKSFIVENAQDSQLHLFTKKAYYIPIIGNIYHTRVGVSNSMKENRKSEHKQTMRYSFDFFKRNGIELDKYDKRLLKYNLSFKDMIEKKSILSFFYVIKSYINSYDPNLGLLDFRFQFKKFFSLLLRKINEKNTFMKKLN